MSARTNSGFLRTVFAGDQVIEPNRKAIIVAVLLGMLVGAAWNATQTSGEYDGDNTVASAEPAPPAE